MKGLLTYYAGKQRLASIIVELIPRHTLYAEPFAGGAAVFFSKRPSEVEVLNDTNGELMNFYRVVKERFDQLAKETTLTLHSRRLHQHAWIIYNYPELFDPIKRAWTIWVLSCQSFSSRLDGAWGYDLLTQHTIRKIISNKVLFNELYTRRLEKVQLENADALYIIRSRDSKESFFYCDPPYYNADLGHFKGYTLQDYYQLLELLSKIEGKFLLSSYPSDILSDFVKRFKWYQKFFEQVVSVNIKGGNPKHKTEVVTANYSLDMNQLILF